MSSPNSSTPPMSLSPEQAALCMTNQLVLSGLKRGPTIGVAFLGVAISAMAYGVTCCQTFYYYRSNKVKSDAWYMKTLVAILLSLDSLHQALIIHSIYYYLVTNYGNAIVLTVNIWSLSAEVIVNAVIACIVESFLVTRVWRLSKNVWVTGACAVFTFAHLVMNLVFPIRALFYPELAIALVKLKSTGSSGLSVAVVADVSISAALSFYLHRSRTGFRRSDDMISKIIALTITTGTLTTLFVVGDLIAYLAAPDDYYVLFFNFMLGKLYINALLTSLNTRDMIRNNQYSDASTSKGVNSIPLAGLRSDDNARHRPVDVLVKKTVESDTTSSAPGSYGEGFPYVESKPFQLEA